MPLLQVKNLTVTINTIDGPVRIIKDLEFSIEKGDRLGIVGESGCGKSITALALMSLLPDASEVSGEILLNDRNLLALNEEGLCGIRGRHIGMIFQEPMTALNPVMSIGSQIAESLILHEKLSKREIRSRVEKLMGKVDLPVERFSLNLFPHQLSGGQRQRVMIAMAIACGPDLLIADEPTTALDVTVQEQILELIGDLVSHSGMALMMISHDLGVIAQTTEKVMVMYAGKVMELGKTVDVFSRMSHPYTNGLFAAIPKPGSSQSRSKDRLYSIPGFVPDFRSQIVGCSFADRCSFTSDNCRLEEPAKTSIEPGHDVWCFHPVSCEKGDS
jgi:peptide/nickel transport system ATP-binding protein